MFSRLVYGLKRHTVEILSLDSMSEKYHVLAVNYIFLVIYTTLESVFVNTLLYRITPDISIVILYRGIAYVFSAITMQFAAYIGQKKTPLTVIRLGGVLFLIMYAVLFFGMDHMRTLMYVTAALAGMGGAFYWSGHNTLVTHYTTAYNRDVGVSILCIIQGIGALLVPIFSGSVISFTESVFGSPTIGYRVMFGLGMLAVIGQVRYQRKLPPVVQLEHHSEIKLALGLFRKEIAYKLVLCYEILRGFRDGAFGFILNMILFQIITSESLVGFNAFLTGIMTIFGAWAYGKLVKPHLRVQYTLIATTVMLVFCALLLFKSNAPVVMLFAMVNSFFALFVVNVAANTTIDVITRDKTSRKCIAESVAIREVFLTVGRVGGLFVFTLFPAGMAGWVSAMLILTASQYLIALFLRLTARSMEAARSTMEHDEE